MAAPGSGAREAAFAGVAAAVPPLGAADIFGNPAAAAFVPYGLNAGGWSAVEDLQQFQVIGGLPGMRVAAVDLFFSFRYLSFGELVWYSETGLEEEPFSAGETAAGVHGAASIFGSGGFGVSVEALTGTLGRRRARSVRLSAGLLRGIGAVHFPGGDVPVFAGIVLSGIEVPIEYYMDGDGEPGRGRGAAGLSLIYGPLLLSGECAVEFGGYMEYAGAAEWSISGNGSGKDPYTLIPRENSGWSEDGQVPSVAGKGAAEGAGGVKPGPVFPAVFLRCGVRSGDLFRTPQIAAGLGARTGSIQVDICGVLSDLPGYKVTLSLGYLFE